MRRQQKCDEIFQLIWILHSKQVKSTENFIISLLFFRIYTYIGIWNLSVYVYFSASIIQSCLHCRSRWKLSKVNRTGCRRKNSLKCELVDSRLFLFHQFNGWSNFTSKAWYFHSQRWHSRFIWRWPNFLNFSSTYFLIPMC